MIGELNVTDWSVIKTYPADNANRMKGIQQWQVKPDTIIIKGKAGPQYQIGDQYIGGVEQWYITNLDDLIKP
ncbi:hypothetical protein [Psychrobacillus sp. NPDC096623]|uniref:hypothetical protein n=1 Tax=Psychrobacillus sp. NPDC096623 TaxID=3364492 RepID=UPI0038164B43